MHRVLVSLALLGGLLAASPVHGQSPDRVLADRAAAALHAYSGLTIFDDVCVDVRGGAVRLAGWVTAPLKRSDLEARIAKIDGVSRVDNEIVVLPVSPVDSDLRMRVARAIYTHSAFWHYASMANPPIHIIVLRGRVTLTGRVNNDVERRLAIALASGVGAVGVTSKIKLDREEVQTGTDRYRRVRTGTAGTDGYGGYGRVRRVRTGTQVTIGTKVTAGMAGTSRHQR